MLRRLALFAVIAALLAVPSAANAAPTHQLPPGVLAAVAQVPPAVTTAQPATVASLALHPSVRTHRAVSGDTLWALAGRFCGNPLLFGRLAAANRVHPDRIYAGTTYRMDCAGVQGTSARAPARPAATTTSSGWVHPLPGAEAVSCWGASRDGGSRRHKGIDLAAAKWTPIRSIAAGVVHSRAYDRGGAGHYVVISHGRGVYTVSMHLVQPSHLRVGTRVRAGTVIAYVGATGNATYEGREHPHLHFETHVGGLWDPHRVNPSPFMRARGVQVGC